MRRTPRTRPPPSPRDLDRPNPTSSPTTPHDLLDSAAMEDDAISTLMDLDEYPYGFDGGLGDLEEGDDGYPARRGPLDFAGFYNAFDGADFDDADLA